jgi:hypothetical protein
MLSAYIDRERLVGSLEKACWKNTYPHKTYSEGVSKNRSSFDRLQTLGYITSRE